MQLPRYGFLEEDVTESSARWGRYLATEKPKQGNLWITFTSSQIEKEVERSEKWANMAMQVILHGETVHKFRQSEKVSISTATAKRHKSCLNILLLFAVRKACIQRNSGWLATRRMVSNCMYPMAMVLWLSKHTSIRDRYYLCTDHLRRAQNDSELCKKYKVHENLATFKSQWILIILSGAAHT